MDSNPLEAKNVRPPVKLTDADKENFFRFFLRDEPYQETMKLFDGKFAIQFRGLTVDDQDQIYTQMAADDKTGEGVSQVAYLNKIQLYRLSLAIVTIDGKPFGEGVKVSDDEKANGTYIVKKRIAAFDKWPVAKLFIINQAYVDFERKMEALVGEVKDPSF